MEQPLIVYTSYVRDIIYLFGLQFCLLILLIASLAIEVSRCVDARQDGMEGKYDGEDQGQHEGGKDGGVKRRCDNHDRSPVSLSIIVSIISSIRSWK